MPTTPSKTQLETIAPDDLARRPAVTTRLAHAGRHPTEHHGFVNIPAFRGSTILFRDSSALAAHDARYVYGRYGSPTTQGLCDILTELHGAAETKLTPSGLSAITGALLSLVRTGDHILVSDAVYQPVRNFCDYTLTRLGVEVEYYPPLIGEEIAERVKANTKLIFIESPGSLTLEVHDIPALASVAHQHDAIVMVDNTWASPLYCQPLALGADVVVESCTKYIVGHSDAMLGNICVNQAYRDALKRGFTALGMSMGSEESYLATRGIRTLALRLEQHAKNAIEVVNWLATRDEVAEIRYPALAHSPGHDRWKRDYHGATGLFSVMLKPVTTQALAQMLDHLTFFGMGYSWGSYESLVLPFHPASGRQYPTWTETEIGLRFHIGLEDPADLIADLDAGFARMHQARHGAA